jgi:hypothetical protein
LANTDYTNITTTPGVYGNSTFVPVITLAANGRIISITNTAITTSGGGGGGSGNANTTGWLPNAVIFANSTGTLSNTANLQFTSTSNTLKVNGSVVIANTQTTNTATMIYNATLNSIDFYFG